MGVVKVGHGCGWCTNKIWITDRTSEHANFFFKYGKFKICSDLKERQSNDEIGTD